MKKQTKKIRKSKTKTKGKSKTSKGQKGGFYPSIYSGISSAAYLAPFAARQAYDFWNRRKSRKTRKTRKISK
jgi:hypothetical protein